MSLRSYSMLEPAMRLRMHHTVYTNAKRSNDPIIKKQRTMLFGEFVSIPRNGRISQYLPYRVVQYRRRLHTAQVFRKIAGSLPVTVFNSARASDSSHCLPSSIKRCMNKSETINITAARHQLRTSCGLFAHIIVK